jgi:hypothetical protein
MTETTLVLARILGGYMAITGVALLIHRDMAKELLERLKTDFPLTFTMAILALVMGLVIVSIHNVWTGPVSIVISLIGWLAVIEGFGIMVLRQRYIALVAPLVRPAWAVTAWSVATVLLGLWLLWAGLGL